MLKKIVSIVFILSVISMVVVNVSATGVLDEIFNQGSSLKGDGGELGEVLGDFLTGTVFEIVGLIGNLIFAAVTVILGLKYIWSSAEGKAEVQESLPAFVVAVIFFYLAGTLVGFVTGATGSASSATNWDHFAGSILWIINTIVKYAALAGLVYTGLRYMFASAEGRASMKTSMGGMVIGVLFVFLATNVVEFIVTAGGQLI